MLLNVEENDAVVVVVCIESGDKFIGDSIEILSRLNKEYVNCGIIPTPTAQYLIKKNDYAGGIVFTASHNPENWNGMKFIDSNGIFLDIVNELIESDSNIYRKMKKNFDSKYTLNYEYSERDMQLFNEGMKKDLLGVYSNGQVALRINYNNFNNNDSNSLWLHIEYRDKDLAKSFLEENRPNTATLDDF